MSDQDRKILEGGILVIPMNNNQPRVMIRGTSLEIVRYRRALADMRLPDDVSDANAIRADAIDGLERLMGEEPHPPFTMDRDLSELKTGFWLEPAELLVTEAEEHRETKAKLKEEETRVSQLEGAESKLRERLASARDRVQGIQAALDASKARLPESVYIGLSALLLGLRRELVEDETPAPVGPVTSKVLDALDKDLEHLPDELERPLFEVAEVLHEEPFHSCGTFHPEPEPEPDPEDVDAMRTIHLATLGIPRINILRFKPEGEHAKRGKTARDLRRSVGKNLEEVATALRITIPDLSSLERGLIDTDELGWREINTTLFLLGSNVSVADILNPEGSEAFKKAMVDPLKEGCTPISNPHWWRDRLLAPLTSAGPVFAQWEAVAQVAQRAVAVLDGMPIPWHANHEDCPDDWVDHGGGWCSTCGMLFATCLGCSKSSGADLPVGHGYPACLSSKDQREVRKIRDGQTEEIGPALVSRLLDRVRIPRFRCELFPQLKRREGSEADRLRQAIIDARLSEQDRVFLGPTFEFVGAVDDLAYVTQKLAVRAGKEHENLYKKVALEVDAWSDIFSAVTATGASTLGDIRDFLRNRHSNR